MLRERRADVERIYLSASELPSGEREAYLDRECGSDQELRHGVEALLAFLETAANGAGLIGSFRRLLAMFG